MSSYLIIDTSSGTALAAENCVLVDDTNWTDEERIDFERSSDFEACELGKELGKQVIPSELLLRSIAAALWGGDADQEWSSDTLDAIADAIRTVRPDLAPADAG